MEVYGDSSRRCDGRSWRNRALSDARERRRVERPTEQAVLGALLAGALVEVVLGAVEADPPEVAPDVVVTAIGLPPDARRKHHPRVLAKPMANGEDAPFPEQRALRERYERLREVQRGLNSRLTKMIAKSGIEESARQLGLWQRGIIVFDEEDDATVLMDFAIHEYRIRGGTTAVERLAKQSRAPAGSDERVVLDALLRARFTLLRVDLMAKKTKRRPTTPSIADQMSSISYW